jgi:hypothetical protein
MQEASSVGVSELPEFPAATAATTAPAPGSPSANLVNARFSRIRHEDSAVLKLKGLPYTTVEQQLLDFFKGFNVKKIAFVYEPDGRPSGLVSDISITRQQLLALPAHVATLEHSLLTRALRYAGFRRIRDEGGSTSRK